MTEMKPHGHGMHLRVLIKIFPLLLKKLFHLKNYQVFMMHPVYVYIIFMWLCVFEF
jgi:hypothetical protein